MESAIPVAAQAVAAVGEHDEIPKRPPPSSRASNRHAALDAICRPETGPAVEVQEAKLHSIVLAGEPLRQAPAAPDPDAVRDKLSVQRPVQGLVSDLVPHPGPDLADRPRDGVEQPEQLGTYGERSHTTSAAAGRSAAS